MLAEWGTEGLVADYQCASLHIDSQKLFGSAMSVISSGNGGALACPTALVVCPDDLTMWRDYAALMANAGVLRGVFVSHDAALSWVRRQAAVFAQIRNRGLGR